MKMIRLLLLLVLLCGSSNYLMGDITYYNNQDSGEGEIGVMSAGLTFDPDTDVPFAKNTPVVMYWFSVNWTNPFPI